VEFDAVTHDFLEDMADQWRTVVTNIVVEWSRKCVTLTVSA